MKKTKNREVYGDNIIYTSENTRQVLKTDSIVDSIIDELIDRSRVGKAKYNTDLDRTDLSLSEWLQHAIEEHLDAVLYLKKIKSTIDGKKKY
jgi:hypothetical protein